MVAAPNLLERRFNVIEPSKAWVTDISCIRTYEGWLYLAVVLDLFSRQVIGWSMKPQMTSNLTIDALLMAVWRRKSKQEVMIHSDQGSQYSSSDWRSFLKANNLIGIMSRRGNCHDNAVAESFFQLLKRLLQRRSGQVRSGQVSDEIRVTQPGQTTNVSAIITMDGLQQRAVSGDAVTQRSIRKDASRGDIISLSLRP